MLGGIFKLTLSISALFLFINLLWQASIADATPILAVDNNLDNMKDDVSRIFAINSPMGLYSKRPRSGKRVKAALDGRLKRFRMLDQDEFQEMLKSLSQQSGDEHLKASQGIDAIGGMQLANYWSPS